MVSRSVSLKSEKKSGKWGWGSLLRKINAVLKAGDTSQREFIDPLTAWLWLAELCWGLPLQTGNQDLTEKLQWKQEQTPGSGRSPHCNCSFALQVQPWAVLLITWVCLWEEILFTLGFIYPLYCFLTLLFIYPLYCFLLRQRASSNSSYPSSRAHKAKAPRPRALSLSAFPLSCSHRWCHPRTTLGVNFKSLIRHASRHDQEPLGEGL